MPQFGHLQTVTTGSFVAMNMVGNAINLDGVDGVIVLSIFLNCVRCQWYLCGNLVKRFGYSPPNI
jgi:hypothetical protein